MRRSLAVLPLVSMVALIACGSSSKNEPVIDPDAGTDSGPPPPARVCKTPGAPPMPWFVDATEEFGLGSKASPLVLATVIVSADFDGDGYADLLTFQGTSERAKTVADGKLTGARALLMNRPSPDDPSRRIYVNTTVESGLLATRDGTNDRGATNAWLGDFDNDGDTDVITCPNDFTAASPPAMVDPCAAFLNDGKGHFTLAAQSDLDTQIFAHAGAVFDYDRDGVLDAFAGGMAHWPNGGPGVKYKIPPHVYKGAGDGTFANTSAEAGLPQKEGPAKDGKTFRHTFGITHCDLDGDGDEDVLLASYGRQENWVFRNDNGVFVEAGHELGLDHDDREDYSDDQSYLCYCAANPTDPTCKPGLPKPGLSCTAFGGPYFRGWQPGVTDQPYMLGGNNFGVACGDIDDDGDMDVMFTTIVHGDVGAASDPTELILNPGNGKKFTRPGNDVTGLLREEKGLYWNHGDNMPTFVDIDLDGRKDITLTSTVYEDETSHTWLWHQKQDGKFEEISDPAGMQFTQAQGVSWVDVDGDGDLDFIVGGGADTKLKIYKNVIGQDQNFTRIRLAGKGAGFSNALGIGARVKVTAGGRTQTLEMQGGMGFVAQQHDFVLTFGLGSACDIDKIEVRWPDAKNTVTTYTGVRANYNVLLKEGDANPIYK